MSFDLTAARLDKGLSIRAAAEQIGVTRGVLMLAENGARPHPGNAKKIADFYDTTVTAIWPVRVGNGGGPIEATS